MVMIVDNGPYYNGEPSFAPQGTTEPVYPVDPVYVQPPAAPPPPQAVQHVNNNVIPMDWEGGPDYDAYGNIIDFSTYSGPPLISVSNTDPRTGGSIFNRYLLSSTPAYQMMVAGTLTPGNVWIPDDGSIYNQAPPTYTVIEAPAVAPYQPAPTPAPNPYPQQQTAPVVAAPVYQFAPVLPVYSAPVEPPPPNPYVAPILTPASTPIPVAAPSPYAGTPAPAPGSSPTVQLPLPAPIASDIPTAPNPTENYGVFYPDVPGVSSEAPAPTSNKTWLLLAAIAGAALLGG